jgi:UDP-2-acetamido-3-amino-2,3-dideoxy-glucuronate N-acetyltransferase
MNTNIESSVLLDPSAQIGFGTRVWHNAQIREHAKIGSNCVIGRNVYVGSDVQIGNNCKIQNNALLYEPASIGEGVFIGPGVILTNDQYPRAVNPDLTLKSNSDWNAVGVSIEEGASIGAGSICVAPIVIGRWALIAAGSVVTKDVPNFALVAGVPARQIGWVGKSGVRLVEKSDSYTCPKTQDRYELVGNTLRELAN